MLIKNDFTLIDKNESEKLAMFSLWYMFCQCGYKSMKENQCRSTPTSGPSQSKRKSPCSQVISL